MGKVLRRVEDSVGPYFLTVPRAHGAEVHHPGLSGAPAGDLPFAFDLETVVRESSRLVDNATSDAHRMITSAHKRAQGLLEKARSDADEIEKRAREDGMAVGRAEALSLIEQELREARETMSNIIESALKQRRSLIESAEKEIVRLGYAVAERVVYAEIERNPDVVVDVARAAVKRLVERERVTIRVNPEDLERMRSHREDMLALGDIREVRVIADGRVDHGGVLLETDGGTIDARIATQLQESRRVLHIDESDG